MKPVKEENLKDLDIKNLDKEIEKLKQYKDKLLVKQGKAYFCSACGEIVKSIDKDSEYNKQKLCYRCWSKKIQSEKRHRLMAIFKEASIVDVIPESNPYSPLTKIKEIILEVYGDYYKIVPKARSIHIEGPHLSEWNSLIHGRTHKDE